MPEAHVKKMLDKLKIYNKIKCEKNVRSLTIGSQLLDGVCSHGWKILITQPWAPTQERETGTHHTE